MTPSIRDIPVPLFAVCAGYDVSKFQALVYDILPSTTAVFSYVIGSWKLSAQIISDVCFITDHAAYASSYKT